VARNSFPLRGGLHPAAAAAAAQSIPNKKQQKKKRMKNGRHDQRKRERERASDRVEPAAMCSGVAMNST